MVTRHCYEPVPENPGQSPLELLLCFVGLCQCTGLFGAMIGHAVYEWRDLYSGDHTLSGTRHVIAGACIGVGIVTAAAAYSLLSEYLQRK